MGFDIYKGNTESLTGGAINAPSRPGAVDPRAQQVDVFPLDAFEFDDPKRNAVPVVRLKAPWVWEVESDISSLYEDIARVDGTIDGQQFFEQRYKRDDGVPTAPADANPVDWFTAIPAGLNPLWMTSTMKKYDGTLLSTWCAPVRFTNAATIIGMLTNELYRVPTDLNGDNGNYTSCKSSLIVYEGPADVTSQFGITYQASTGVTVDDAYFISDGIVHVTNMTVDVGSVEITGTRLTTSVTKEFSVTKARQGEQAPVYSMSSSTPIVLVKPDLERNPNEVVFSSTSQVGLSEPQPYAGIFKIYVDGLLFFANTTPATSYTWNGFDPIFPATTLFPSLTLYPVPVFSGDVDLAFMQVELWDVTDSVLLDRQSVVFMADWSNYINDILASVPDYTPTYIGKYYAAHPTTYRKGDSWLVYDEDDSPIVRGLYWYDGTALFRVDGTTASESRLLALALSDIFGIVQTLPIGKYGTTANYGAVTYIENLVSNAIFTNYIQIGQDRVTDLDTTLSGIESSAEADATAKANAAAVTASAYADGIVTAEEERAIADATAKANAAQAAADLSAKNAMAVELGYTSYANMVTTIGATKKTIITGGYINTYLIEVAQLLAQAITVSTGGSIRYETGSGVQKRTVQLADEKIDWLDTPGTSPASPEQLRARIGRLGVGGAVLMDGDFVAPIEASWGADAELLNINGSNVEQLFMSNGSRRVAYLLSSGTQLWEIVYSSGAWGSAVLIDSSIASYTGISYIENPDCSVRIAYTDSGNSLIERIYTTSWSASPTTIRSSGYDPRYFRMQTGLLRLGFFTGAKLVERTNDGTGWTATDTEITSFAAVEPTYVELDDGTLKVAYIKETAGSHLYEKTYTNGSWPASDTVINGAESGRPKYQKDLIGGLRIIYISYTPVDLFPYITERLFGTAWGTQTTVVSASASYPCPQQLADGSLSLIYVTASRIYQKTLQRYARIGAGIIESGGDDTNGRYIKYGDGTMMQWGLWIGSTGTLATLPNWFGTTSGSSTCRYITVTFPATFYNTAIILTANSQVAATRSTPTVNDFVGYLIWNTDPAAYEYNWQAIGRWKA